MSAAADDGGGDAFTKFKAAWLKAVALDLDLSHFAARLASVVGIHLNRETWVAFPGQARLAEQLGATRRGVQGGMDQLVERGHIHVIASPNRKGGNTYQPLLNGVAGSPPGKPKKAHGAQSHANRGAHEGGSHANGRAHETSSHANGRAHENGSHANGHAGFMRTAVRPNHLREPLEPSAAAQPRSGGKQADGSAREVGPQPFLDPAEVAQADRRKALDAAWSSMVGPDLARTLGKTDALHQAIAGGEVTAEDVEAGIRDGMAKGDSAPASWRWFGGWARQAAKRRAAGGRPDRPRDELAAFAPPPAGMIELPGGWRHTEAALAAELIKFKEGSSWNQTVYDWPPDSPFNRIPVDILARHLDMVKLKDGRTVPACAAKRAAEDFHAFHGREWCDSYGSEPGTPGCLLPDDLQAEALRPRKAIPMREDPMRADVIHAKFG